jgi:aldehyde:ferredoxin oxidoreductase
MEMSFGRFLEIGARGFNLERMVNLRLGLSGDEDWLPERLMREGQKTGRKMGPVPLQPLKKQFYRNRGWDEQGRPSGRLLERLGLAWLVSGEY